MICTIYSHYPDFDRVTGIVRKVYPQGILNIVKQDEFNIIEVDIKGGLFNASKKIKITYRERSKPSYQIPETDDSPLTANLKGLYGYVASLPASNEQMKNLFLHKIQTLNSEFSIQEIQGQTKEMKTLIQSLAGEFDAVLFVQADTIISKSAGQHFLDKNLNLIIDGEGNCEIENLEVNIDAVYFDPPYIELTEDQTQRKARSEQLIEQRGIKVNRHLPCVEAENETTIRLPKEIAQRVCVLAITNSAAFDDITNDYATELLKKYNLWSFVTPKEKEFLANPTEQSRMQETWKCECIWTLMWALNKVDELGFPDELCNLKNIHPDEYPIGPDKDPNDFINAIASARPMQEILDAADLYYRLDWACVDARINNRQMEAMHSGVVYERHYALNWLIRYSGQEWDDVSCDT